MTHRCSLHCILPPFILKNLMEHGTPEQKDSARRTLLSSTTLRADRRIMARLGTMAGAAGGGGKQRTVFDCQHRPTTRSAVLIRKESDGPRGDPSADEAFNGVGKTYDFYSKLFHRNSVDNAGMRLDSYVHYARDYPNAMWDGRRMIFGDGDGFLFSRLTQSLDVIAHELTHGVTQYACNLEYRGQSGALNESLSDVFGSLVRQWSASQTAEEADWLIGADCWSPKIAGDALRSLKSPGSAYDDPALGRDPQPAHMRNYHNLPETPDDDMGGVHVNSGIPNHAFYLFATKLGGNAWEAPGQIWYMAQQRGWSNMNFSAFAALTHSLALEFFDANSGVRQALQEAWNEVGIRVGKKEKERKPARPADHRMDAPEDVMSAIGRLSSELAQLHQEIASLKQQGTHFH